MVQRVWHANGLKRHLVKTFNLSNDPCFIEKLEDVVGLYMNRPENVLVFCVDEKSQIQALDRNPIRPADEKGTRRNHDPRLQAQRHNHTVRRAEPLL
jgi:DNA polymerase III psi subunit